MNVTDLSEAIADIDLDAGRQRVKDYLQKQPFTHSEAVPGRLGMLRRMEVEGIEEDGAEAIGQFVDRVIEPLQP